MITGVVLLGTALVVGAFGAAIRAGHTQLIAGYDAERVTDEDGVATFVGTALVLVGAFILAFGVLELGGLLPEEGWVWLVFTGGILALTVVVVVGTHRFQG